MFSILRSEQNEKKKDTKNSPGKSTVTNRVTLREILRGDKKLVHKERIPLSCSLIKLLFQNFLIVRIQL